MTDTMISPVMRSPRVEEVMWAATSAEQGRNSNNSCMVWCAIGWDGWGMGGEWVGWVGWVGNGWDGWDGWGGWGMSEMGGE